jgi:hypothetical protein
MKYGESEWKSLPVADRLSFYELAKHDLVEEDAYGNDAGRDPRNISREVLAAYHAPVPVLRAIRAKCIDCSGGNDAEARKCTVLRCDLWPFRMGTNPWREKLPPERATKLLEARKLRASGGKSGVHATMVPGEA